VAVHEGQPRAAPTADDEADWRSSLAKLAALEAHHEIALGSDSSAQRALRVLLPRLVAQRSGSVVVVGSRNVERPCSRGGAVPYTVAKSAVVALARAIAVEVPDAGVRVNAVLPSTIDTARNRAAMADADVSRWVKPESIAAVIEFLLSDAARDVSGAVFRFTAAPEELLLGHGSAALQPPQAAGRVVHGVEV
jgi:NAD(P)-dependent dehydrogenase (short-subunit alcohol dehydrogenase family)